MSFVYNPLEGVFDIGTPGGGGGGGNAEKWIAVVDGTPVQMVPNGFYYVNPGVSATLILPVTAKVGTRNRIVGGSGASFFIQQNADQRVIYAGTATEIGTDGTINAIGATAIELLVTVADTIWINISGSANAELQTSSGIFKYTNPTGMNDTGVLQYNNQTGNFNYAQGTTTGDMLSYWSLSETFVVLNVPSNQQFLVADDSQVKGWRNSTIQETADGEFLSGLGRNNGFGTITNAAYSPLLNPATGLVFPTADQAGLSANGALAILAKQFGVDINLLVNIFSGMTWNYTMPGGYPYSVQATNNVIYVDTSSADNTVTLPDSTDFGKVWLIFDYSYNASNHPFTLTTVGGTVLIGNVTSQVCALDGGGFILQWDGTKYNILNVNNDSPFSITTGDANKIISTNNGLTLDARSTSDNNDNGIRTVSNNTGTGYVELTNTFGGMVTTTDDTPTLIASCPLDQAFSTYQLTIKFAIYNETDALGITSTIVNAFRTTNSGGTIVAIPNPDYTDSDEAFDVSIDVNSAPNVAEVIVTGIAGKTIRWKCLGTYLYV